MNIAQEPTAILGLLKEHEIALSQLYEVYASTFPEFENFWAGLSVEEKQHAEWIDKLKAIVVESPNDFVVDRFPLAAIEHSIGYVREQILKAQQQDITPTQAFSTALDLEEGLLEKKLFETFDGDSKEIERTLALLDQYTQNHYNKVRKMWIENK